MSDSAPGPRIREIGPSFLARAYPRLHANGVTTEDVHSLIDEHDWLDPDDWLGRVF
jgi:hypothetical protein